LSFTPFAGCHSNSQRIPTEEGQSNAQASAGTDVLRRKFKETVMAKNAHQEAATHHENAAKAHRTAAEHHGAGNHEEGKKHSTTAHEHSGKAHESSKNAHQKSQQQK
jgi:hypothetical protein